MDMEKLEKLEFPGLVERIYKILKDAIVNLNDFNE